MITHVGRKQRQTTSLSVETNRTAALASAVNSCQRDRFQRDATRLVLPSGLPDPDDLLGTRMGPEEPASLNAPSIFKYVQPRHELLAPAENP